MFSTILLVPEDYSTIQVGVDAAVDGDTVLVNEGIYYENIHLTKSIVLASYAIYDNLDDWVIFDDVFYEQWVINPAYGCFHALRGDNISVQNKKYFWKS